MGIPLQRRSGLSLYWHTGLQPSPSGRQPLVLVLGRQNGPQLPDHGQDVAQLELGQTIEVDLGLLAYYDQMLKGSRVLLTRSPG